MIIKRIICAAAAAVLLVALASCGHGTEKDTDTVDMSDTTDTVDTVGTDASEPVTTDTEAATVTETEPITETEPVTETEPTTETNIVDVSVEPQNEIGYVALGDSIAFGYALENVEADRYSTLVESYLDEHSARGCVCSNYGINGLTSGGLIDNLVAGFAPELEGAELITVSIGANNVLGPSVTMLTQYTLNLLVGDRERAAELNTALYASFTEETEAGIADFERDLPNIIALLRAKAPDARIIFQTVYSPYANFDLTLDFAVVKTTMADESDRLVGRLNDIIKANADKLGYEVADVYAAFDGRYGLVNAGTVGGTTTFTGFDPHPTREGHRVIADVICDILKEDYE